MGRVQSSLVLFFLGLFLLSVVVFRHEWFYGANGLIYLFEALVALSVALLFVSLFRLFGAKWWHGLVVLVGLELLLMGAFHLIGSRQPRSLPERLTGYLTNIYTSGFMNCIQYDEEVSHFDQQLQYLLTPGSHEFNNVEFKTRVDVNSKGIRDSEANLQSPEMIFLGDSFTMGWGVDNEESYVREFERKTGKRVLNAGVSSFGTAREYMLFKHLPTDSCKVLFIQYCENDLLENFMFYHKGERLAEEQELLEGYRKYVRINLVVKNYYPFKHVYWVIRGLNAVRNLETRFRTWQERLARAEIKEQTGPSFPTDHQPYVVKVLKALRDEYHGPIVFFHLDKQFSPTLRNQLTQMIENNKELNIFWLDTQAAGLSAGDYFLLDMHLNEKGHQKLAKTLTEFVMENQLIGNRADSDSN